MPKRSPLALYLEKHELTQVEFAQISGVPQSQISLYTNEDPKKRRKPGLANANKIARATRGEVPPTAWDGSPPVRAQRLPATSHA